MADEKEGVHLDQKEWSDFAKGEKRFEKCTTDADCEYHRDRIEELERRLRDTTRMWHERGEALSRVNAQLEASSVALMAKDELLQKEASQLAAARAEIERLRHALETVRPHVGFGHAPSGERTLCDIIDEAFAAPVQEPKPHICEAVSPETKCKTCGKPIRGKEPTPTSKEE